MIMFASASYGLIAVPWGVALGLLLHMAWHILDGADGDLARLTGRSSANGELVDGICDYAGHIVLYVTMGAIAAGQLGGMGWALMWAAGASRVVQAGDNISWRSMVRRGWVAGRWYPMLRGGDILSSPTTSG